MRTPKSLAPRLQRPLRNGRLGTAESKSGKTREAPAEPPPPNHNRLAHNRRSPQRRPAPTVSGKARQSEPSPRTSRTVWRNEVTGSPEAPRLIGDKPLKD